MAFTPIAQNPRDASGSVMATLRLMKDDELQQYANLHKNDPYIFPLAFQESQTRKQVRAEAQAAQAAQNMPQGKVVDQDLAMMAPAPQMPQQMMAQAPQPLPENVGIGALPAKNLQGLCGGGIVAFDEGGEVPRYNGQTKYGSLVRSEADRLGLDPDTMMRLFGTESSWNPNAVSPKGAKYGAGIGQLSIDAAADMGLSDEDRYVPEKAIPAAMGYYKRQLDKFGSPDKALAAYNWGPGKVEKHIAKAEKSGTDFSVGLPPETAKYLTKILPIGSAQAGTTTVPTATAPTGPRSQWAAMGDLGRNLVGAGETALQYGTGLLAIPTAGGAAVLGQLPNVFSGKGMDKKEMERSFLEKAGQVTYEPRTEAGKAQSEGLASILTNDLKLPPYLAHTGSVSPQRRVSNAADLAQIAAERTRTSETPRLAGPTTDTTMVQGRGAPPVKEGNLVRKQAQDLAEAAAWREAAARAEKMPDVDTTPEVLARNAATERAQTVARIGGSDVAPAAAGAAGAASAAVGSPFGDIDLGATDASLGAASRDYLLSRDDKTELKGLGKEAAKEAGLKTKGWGADDFIAIGLGILSGQSPNALTNIGEGGLKGLAMRQARIKEEADTAYKEALAKHYGVDPFVQRLQALKDPENAKMFKLMKEMEREPMTKEALWKQFSASPMALALDPKDMPAAFQRYVQSYEATMGPIGGLPSNVEVTRRSS